MSAASAYTAREKMGLALVIVSCVLYAALLGVPFLPLSSNLRFTVAAILVIAGEGSFWLGCLVVGKEFMMFLRRKLWPGNWHKKASVR